MSRTGSESAKAQLAKELQALRDRSDPPLTLAAIAKRSRPPSSFSTSSVGDWFTGKSIPSDVAKLRTLVEILTAKPVAPELVRLYRRAESEAHANRGGAPTGSATTADAATAVVPDPLSPPPGQIWLPRMIALHYAKVDRLRLILSEYGIDDAVFPPRIGGLGFREGMFATEAVLNELRRIDLRPRRLTPEFRMRSLREGDLVVFNRKIHTRNGPLPGSSTELTGDLNSDPLIWMQKNGVRIILPIDPEFIVSSTSYSDFRAGTIRMAGLFRIKYRRNPTDPPHLPKTPKVLYHASPLVLGVADDPSSDLTSNTVRTGYNLKTEEQVNIGPWLNRSNTPDGKDRS